MLARQAAAVGRPHWFCQLHEDRHLLPHALLVMAAHNAFGYGARGLTS